MILIMLIWESALSPQEFLRSDPFRLSSYGRRCKKDALVGMMSLFEKQKDLRPGNYCLFKMVHLEDEKFQNSYYVPRNHESPLISTLVK